MGETCRAAPGEIEIRSPWLPWVGLDPLNEPLRGDPRGEDLRRRMD
jgi:hypothetical protein